MIHIIFRFHISYYKFIIYKLINYIHIIIRNQNHIISSSIFSRFLLPNPGTETRSVKHWQSSDTSWQTHEQKQKKAWGTALKSLDISQNATLSVVSWISFTYTSGEWVRRIQSCTFLSLSQLSTCLMWEKVPILWPVWRVIAAFKTSSPLTGSELAGRAKNMWNFTLKLQNDRGP